MLAAFIAALRPLALIYREHRSVIGRAIPPKLNDKWTVAEPRYCSVDFMKPVPTPTRSTTAKEGLAAMAKAKRSHE